MNRPQKKTQAARKSSKRGTVRLSTEDRARMARLFEETSSRLQEMALIVARNLHFDTSKGIQPKFNWPESQSNSKVIRPKGMEVVCDSEGNCGCYFHDEGICEPC